MKRKTYDVKFKLSALAKLKANEGNVSRTATELGVTRKMVRDWKNKEHLYLSSGAKLCSKSFGSGPKPKFPDLEEKLTKWFNTERMVHKRTVGYSKIQRQIGIFEREDNKVYSRSYKWVSGFLKRHDLSIQQTTHEGQADNIPLVTKKRVTSNYLDKLNHFTAQVSDSDIYNMDEISVYEDIPTSRNNSCRGEKSTETLSTGDLKKCMSVVLCISKSGLIKRTMIIIKGLARVPKINVPDNCFLVVANKNSTKSSLMLDWVNHCFDYDEEVTQQKILLLDASKSQNSLQFDDSFSKSNFLPVIIPPRTAHYLQPLNVSINSAFKADLRAKWDHWVQYGDRELTPKGNRKKPSWDCLINWISEAAAAINTTDIKRSFKLCGISSIGEPIDTKELSDQLRTIINLGEETKEIEETRNAKENENTEDTEEN